MRVRRGAGGQAARLHLSPHRHIQRHLALGHEHASVYLHTDRLSQFDPGARAIRAIAIDRFSRGAGDVCESRGRHKYERYQSAHHVSRIAKTCFLTKPLQYRKPSP